MTPGRTDQRHAAFGDQLVGHPTAVPDRLARHRDAANPAARARRAAHSSTGPSSRARQPTRRRARPGSRGRDHDRLPPIGQIDSHDRVLARRQRPQTRQSGVPVLVTTGQAAIVGPSRVPFEVSTTSSSSGLSPPGNRPCWAHQHRAPAGPLGAFVWGGQRTSATSTHAPCWPEREDFRQSRRAESRSVMGTHLSGRRVRYALPSHQTPA